MTESYRGGGMISHSGPPVALVVDDEPPVLQILVRCLQAEGFEVLAANSRAEAERTADKGGSIDVLVTDINLGDGWGGELAFRLQEEHPNLAVVFISGLAGEDPILRHGIQDHMVFLEKPFTIVELAEAVRRAMDGVPGSQSN
jgi:two-component system cell cycle sensor histidine kinase/response regulator CckA